MYTVHRPHQEADVLIIGAGPSGLTAALRCLQLGYRVVVVDQKSFPRPNIGESMTPGIWGILDYLEAREATQACFTPLQTPSQVIWSRQNSEPHQRGVAQHWMVDRARFDYELLKLAQLRGACCIVPGKVRSVSGSEWNRRVEVESSFSSTIFDARLIFDARGRRSQESTQRIPIAPPLLACWMETHSPQSYCEVRVEALAEGWLWGAPLQLGRYRVMGFYDPTYKASLSGYLTPQRWLYAALAHSRLFSELGYSSRNSEAIEACAATPYVDSCPWQAGYIKLGDAAFALDPLSSTGVEKAMRFSLQAVIAAHTVLSGMGDSLLAETFFHNQCVESVAQHAVWTQQYYEQGWPGPHYPFWNQRSQSFQSPRYMDEVMAKSLMRAIHDAKYRLEHPGFDVSMRDRTTLLARLLTGGGGIVLSSDLRFIDVPCVVEECVQIRTGISHPNLQRPVAFVDGEELVPMLRRIYEGMSFSDLLKRLSQSMPLSNATKIIGWMFQQGLLQAQ